MSRLLAILVAVSLSDCQSRRFQGELTAQTDGALQPIRSCDTVLGRQDAFDVTVRDASEVLDLLLEGGHTIGAGRVAGAFRNIERDRIADDILKSMQAAGYTVRAQDRFRTKTPDIMPIREQAPLANRIRLIWHDLKAHVTSRFPSAPELPVNTSS